MRRILLAALLLWSSCALAQELPLYNGPEYTSYYHGTAGNEYFLSDSLPAGDVMYDGILYKNVDILYNLADQLLFVRHPIGYTIQLIKDRVRFFSLAGRTFINYRPANQQGHAFYELLYKGTVLALAQRNKTLLPAYKADEPMKFVDEDEYFISVNDSVYSIADLRDVSFLFSDRKNDIREYASSKSLDFNSAPGKAIAEIAAFIDSAGNWLQQTEGIAEKKVPEKSNISKSLPAKSNVQKKETVQPPRSSRQENILAENKIYEIGTSLGSRKERASLAGYVREASTGEPVAGAFISVDSTGVTIATDQFGYYSLSLSPGRHVLNITSVGLKNARRHILLRGSGRLDIDMYELVRSLKAVEVVAEKNSNVRNTQMSVEKLTIKTIKQVPVVFGEADVLRVVMTLPGVSSTGEASTGLNVRGGSADQNLILFNDATIFNPSHLFGFFSAFNPDLVKAVELYKSSIPERFGGRLSSVLDVSAREGNNKKFSGTGGIGPLTSKLTLEGPINWISSSKNRSPTTFVAGARTTYSNWILRSLPNESYNNSRASFYDLNLNITHPLNSKNTMYATGYLSNDRFRLNSDTSFVYGNKNFNVKWKHLFNNKLYAVVTAGLDHYDFAVSNDTGKVSSFALNFDISQAHFRTSFTYSPSNRHSIEAGVNSIHYTIHPGSFMPAGSNSLVAPEKLQTEQALETGFYLGDKYSVSENLSIQAGIRFSVFNYLGPHQVYTYVPGVPRDTSTIADTIGYGRGAVIKTYYAPEYRVSGRYALSDNNSLKLSFNTTRQYIHMLSNTTIISPTDIWKLSDTDIKPQAGMQFSAGYYHNLFSNSVETSVEVFYKRMKNILDYKSGAKLINNQHIVTDLINAEGKSYGMELLVRKTTGKLNGWISYTWSRAFLRQNDPLAGELINGGQYYPASFDRPNTLNAITNYRFTYRFSASVNVVYTTGRPITIPVAVFNQGGAERVYYSNRNQYRVPDYFRADLSFTLEGNHRVKQKIHNSWSFGFYNLTGRKNPYSVYFRQEGGTIKGYQLSVFGTILPFVTYNFRF